MTEAVNDEAWLADGWYARGTDGQGEWFGVPEREEGKIFLEPQPWAVMAGVADDERGRTAMDSVREKLFTPNGIQILTPACGLAPSGNFHVFPKGAKENGGIFCHPNPWAVCAETILGRGDRAFEYYKAILPPAASEPDAAHYCAEPYVYGQQRYGREHREFGKCAGTWLTGTAAWNYVAATQYILGIQPGLGRPARGPLRAGRLEGVPRQPPLPRRHLRHHVQEPGRRQQGRQVGDGGRRAGGGQRPARLRRPSAARRGRRDGVGASQHGDAETTENGRERRRTFNHEGHEGHEGRPRQVTWLKTRNISLHSSAMS